MIIQKSFKVEKPTLYLVPTPIGNLSEMSPRAIDILKNVDVIACEDTRVTKKLLTAFQIQNKVVQHQSFNEDASAKGLLQLLKEGKNIAIVSDAGYPLISDPGYTIVQLAIQNDFHVVPLSGPNAVNNALVASGLTVVPYLFVGFLNAHQSARLKQLAQYVDYPMTLVFYEAPHRILKTLQDCLDVFGNRKACIARELTKQHEEFIRGELSELVTLPPLKGEIVLIIEGKQKTDELILDIEVFVKQCFEANMSKKDIVKALCEKGMLKNEAYAWVHKKWS